MPSKRKKKKSGHVLPQVEESAGEVLLSESALVVADEALNAKERQICEQLAIKGLHHFSEIGWDREKESRFLARPKVRMEIDRLVGMYKDGEGLRQRMRFFAEIRLMAMLPGALAIVQKMLVGRGNSQNPVSIEDLPTTEQYLAARDIIEWCGIAPRGGGINVQVNVSDTLPQLDRGVSGVSDKERYEIAAVVSRDRVRSALDEILGVLNESEENREEILNTHRQELSRRTRKQDIRRVKNYANDDSDESD